MYKKANGFTIVELLVVIVVIAILAAITLVSYNGIQNNAKSTLIRSNFSNAAKQLEIYRIENGQYPRTAADFKEAIPVSLWNKGSNDPYYRLGYCTNNEEYGLYARQVTTDQWWVVGSGIPVGESSVAGTSDNHQNCSDLIGISSYMSVFLKNSSWTSWAN